MGPRMMVAGAARALAWIFLLSATSLLWAQAPQQRTFTFSYGFTVRNPQPGKRLRLWFPMAHSDKYQQVRLLSVKSDLPARQTVEREYGNRMFYAETRAADRAEYKFEAVYEVTRAERLGMQAAKLQEKPRPAELERYLRADSLVPTTGKLAQIAAQQTQGQRSEIEKARAIYEYVFKNMRYDKSGTGWGRGDAEWACDSKRGNCTDFHSLFASMARSRGIPTRFEIGFPLPGDKHAGEIAGYHCWSDFWLDSKGWIPIDISEAWKHPDKHDYFFGAHDVNRVQFSMGRDIRLEPQQEGPPLNYFVYPYVESDGREFANVSNAFRFEDKAQLKAALK